MTVRLPSVFLIKKMVLGSYWGSWIWDQLRVSEWQDFWAFWEHFSFPHDLQKCSHSIGKAIVISDRGIRRFNALIYTGGDVWIRCKAETQDNTYQNSNHLLPLQKQLKKTKNIPKQQTNNNNNQEIILCIRSYWDHESYVVLYFHFKFLFSGISDIQCVFSSQRKLH